MASMVTAPTLLPEAGSQLSDGVVVETRLRAALLGVRILRVDGIILMSPARLSGAAPATASADAAPVQGPTGTALAQAARLLRENDDRLRKLR